MAVSRNLAADLGYRQLPGVQHVGPGLVIDQIRVPIRHNLGVQFKLIVAIWVYNVADAPIDRRIDDDLLGGHITPG